MQHIHRNNVLLGHRAQRFVAMFVSNQHMELSRLRLAFTVMLLIVSFRFESNLAAAIRAEASFSPPQIAQGDQSRYQIHVIESSTSSAPKQKQLRVCHNYKSQTVCGSAMGVERLVAKRRLSMGRPATPQR